MEVSGEGRYFSRLWTVYSIGGYTLVSSLEQVNVGSFTSLVKKKSVVSLIKFNINVQYVRWRVHFLHGFNLMHDYKLGQTGSKKKKKTICESSCLWQIKPNEVSNFDIVFVRPLSTFHLMGMLGMIWC